MKTAETSRTTPPPPSADVCAPPATTAGPLRTDELPNTAAELPKMARSMLSRLWKLSTGNWCAAVRAGPPLGVVLAADVGVCAGVGDVAGNGED